MIVLIGNPNAIVSAPGSTEADDAAPDEFQVIEGDRITEFRLPEGTMLGEAKSTVVSGLNFHLAPGTKPAWIQSDVPQVAEEIGRHFGFDPEKQPEKFKRPAGWGREAVVGSGRGIAAAASALLSMQAFLLLVAVSLHIKTNAGVDLLCRLLGDTSSNGTGSYAPANYIGLTANSTAPAAGNTALTGEITTGTLARAQATYAHTNGTNVFTLTKTFTSDQTVSVAKIGVFNASTAGTMALTSLLNAPVSLVSGDSFSVTHTVTV